MDEIRKIPIVTRSLCGATLGVTLPIMLRVLSPYRIIFSKELVTQSFELWRPFTSMFYAGSGLSFLFDFIMLYRNSDGLESVHYAGRSSDYAWQVLLNMFGILALNLPLGSVIHFRPLLLSIVTLSANLTPEALTSVFGLITLPHKYLPYAFVAMDLVLGGPSAAASAVTGVISGYAWWYLMHSQEAGRPGASYGRAPTWLKDLMKETGESNVPGVGRVLNAGGSTVAAARRQAQKTTQNIAGGHAWGSGQRLGSD